MGNAVNFSSLGEESIIDYNAFGNPSYGETFEEALNCLISSLFYNGHKVVNNEVLEFESYKPEFSDYYLQIEDIGWLNVSNSIQNKIYRLRLIKYNEPDMKKLTKRHYLSFRGTLGQKGMR